MLTPAEFSATWGKEALVRMPQSSIVGEIPSAASQFLVEAGLPAFLRFFDASNLAKVTFNRLQSGITPVLNEKTVGPPLPSDWSVYMTLGDEFFCNGAAWWCLHKDSGHVVRIDIEVDARPIEFANTSVAHFASALMTALRWSESCNHKEWMSALDRLQQALAAVDPPSMQSDRHFWPSILQFLRDEPEFLQGEPQRLLFEKGTWSAGQKALEQGPW
jgi:hypothetical protein